MTNEELLLKIFDEHKPKRLRRSPSGYTFVRKGHGLPDWLRPESFIIYYFIESNKIVYIGYTTVGRFRQRMREQRAAGNLRQKTKIFFKHQFPGCNDERLTQDFENKEINTFNPNRNKKKHPVGEPDIPIKELEVQDMVRWLQMQLGKAKLIELLSEPDKRTQLAEKEE